ncbi:branched-chain amino acid transport system substrate-binding protein [Monaibacterium marinum]|uniref:Branched-chain amino acid transport system substrate-binding protein n=1 Tax=Pontivivens marinum TaxID=1690039 RepID=A0A2C9CU92_9RHOB|nr:ABC transporter substrate-binding protein [Monaibacterium marinum]SOH93959.1 branched-chain amino acid transport system substrate-binding protein [Monaibacterium marinum]
MKTTFAALAATALIASGANAQTRGVTDDEIIIGAYQDLSGGFAAFSVPAVEAVNQLFEEVNAAGGIHGRQLRYIVEDHGYQVPRAAQAANKLVNRDNVFAMLLSLGTPHNLAAFRVMDPNGVPSVFPLTAARQMIEGPEELRYTATASYYDGVRAAAGFLIEGQGIETVCSMYIPSDFGEEIHEATVDEAEARGVNYAAETTHRPDESDFTGALARLREAGCELITVALTIRPTITVVATAKQMGWDDARFLVSSAGFHTAIAKVPGGITEGLYAGAGWQDLEARMETPEVAEWVATMMDRTGEFPGTGALLGQSAAHALVNALEIAGPDLTLESFTAAMETLDYDDPIAGNHMQMGPGDHEGATEIFISQIQDGGWVLVDTVETD